MKKGFGEVAIWSAGSESAERVAAAGAAFARHGAGGSALVLLRKMESQTNFANVESFTLLRGDKSASS